MINKHTDQIQKFCEFRTHLFLGKFHFHWFFLCVWLDVDFEQLNKISWFRWAARLSVFLSSSVGRSDFFVYSRFCCFSVFNIFYYSVELENKSFLTFFFEKKKKLETNLRNQRKFNANFLLFCKFFFVCEFSIWMTWIFYVQLFRELSTTITNSPDFLQFICNFYVLFLFDFRKFLSSNRLFCEILWMCTFNCLGNSFTPGWPIGYTMSLTSVDLFWFSRRHFSYTATLTCKKGVERMLGF